MRANPLSSDVKALRGLHVASLDSEMKRFSRRDITLRCYRAVIPVGVVLIVASTFRTASMRAGLSGNL